jgi:asparagine synthetase B (glutamine-hydrolysing)
MSASLSLSLSRTRTRTARLSLSLCLSLSLSPCQDRKLSLAINGEIYNHKELRAEIDDESKFRTNSDCEPVVHLYEQIGHEVPSKLDA